MDNRQKSYGKRYLQAKVKFKFNKTKLFCAIFALLCLGEIVWGILWALGL